ncbi:MAG: DUF362 domain-containing protein [Polyangiales bacterium]
MSLKNLFPSRKSGGRTIESRDLMDEYLAKDFSRRHLLQGALASAALIGCGSDPAPGNPTPGADASRDAAPADASLPDVAPDKPPARMPHLVGMGQSDDHIMAAEAALAETHNFDFIQRGQRVYLKVNTNSGDPFPYSTSPDMIRWVVGKIRERGGEVFIGDRSFFGDTGTMRNFQGNGIADVAQELGVDLMVFGDTAARDSAANSVDWMDLPDTLDGLDARSTIWQGTMRIPVPVAQADHIISLAVTKTHFIATFTMSMKCMIGIINPVDRSRTANLGSHSTAGDRLYKQVAYMNKGGPALSMVVLDGWNALISGGPTPTDRPPSAPATFTGGVTGEPHCVIISRDRLAADMTGVALLKTVSPRYERIMTTSVWTNKQVARAMEAGLGINDRAMYDLSGPTVMNLDTIRENVLA